MADLSATSWVIVPLCHAGREYPPTFPTTAKHIYKQLLRVFAHIYHAHFSLILHLSLEAHWNALFAHFLAFGKEYDLLDLRDLRTPGGSVLAAALPAALCPCDPTDAFLAFSYSGMTGGVAELAERWREMRILDV